MEVLQAISQRSSTRKYTDQTLSDEQIKTLLEAGLKAPTARNEQEIHFTVLKKENPLTDELIKVQGSAFNYGAPVLFVLSGKTDFGWSAVDAGIAVENMALAAEEMGLGSVIIGCIKKAFSECPELSTKLQLPAGYDYKIALAAGYKADNKVPHTYNFDSQVTIL